MKQRVTIMTPLVIMLMVTTISSVHGTASEWGTQLPLLLLLPLVLQHLLEI
jgi:hypothetical protein